MQIRVLLGTLKENKMKIIIQILISIIWFMLIVGAALLYEEAGGKDIISLIVIIGLMSLCSFAFGYFQGLSEPK